MTSTTQSRRSRWTMIPTADLVAVAGTLPDVDPDLVAAAKAGGFEDPIYVTDASTGLRIVDGMRRLAAAVAAELAELATTDRPVIRLSQLTAHPGNVRTDLRLNPEMRASIEEEGILTALTLTRTPEGGIRVIDGHRRLATGLEVGETHAPYVWHDRDEASQYLDMVSTARHREGLTGLEEANALFSAVQAGASVGRAAKAAGLKVSDAKRAVRAGGSQAVSRIATTAELSLTDMERLADLEAEPEILATVEAAITRAPAYAAHHIQNGIQTMKARKAAAAHRAELEAAGARIRDLAEMGERAIRVRRLSKVNPQDHAANCKGAVWVLEDADADSYSQWCTQVVLYGHATEAEVTGKPEKKASDPAETRARKNVVKGNLDWAAAETIRREWLTAFLAKTAPSAAHQKVMQEAVTLHLLTATDIMDDYAKGKVSDLLIGQLLGKGDTLTRSKLGPLVAKASGPRRTVLCFAVLAAAYEAHMDRAAWRTDATGSSVYRPHATAWLKLLTTLGYEPGPIELATRDGKAYDALAHEPK